MAGGGGEANEGGPAGGAGGGAGRERRRVSAVPARAEHVGRAVRAGRGPDRSAVAARPGRGVPGDERSGVDHGGHGDDPGGARQCGVRTGGGGGKGPPPERENGG